MLSIEELSPTTLNSSKPISRAHMDREGRYRTKISNYELPDKGRTKAQI